MKTAQYTPQERKIRNRLSMKRLQVVKDGLACELWQNNSEHFISWSLAEGYSSGKKIVMKDTKGIYSPENCHIVAKAMPCSSSLYYWPESVDDYFMEFNATEDEQKRNQIYEEKIKEPLEKMVECVYNRFKYEYINDTADNNKKDGVSHVIKNASLYHKSKGKSFGYFSIVAKNFFLAANIVSFKQSNRQVPLTELNEDGDENDETSDELATICREIEDGKRQVVDNIAFLKFSVQYFEQKKDQLFTKAKELVIFKELLKLMKEDITQFTFKKQYYAVIRKKAGVNTCSITKVIKKLSAQHHNIVKAWRNSNVL